MLHAVVLTVVAALAVVGPAGAASALSNPTAGSTTRAGGVTLQTEEAELTKMDREFVIAVRLAGLWEVPAGKMAMEKGVSPRVREVGQMIASQHVRLDALALAAAKEVNITLPNRPIAVQRTWLDEMADAEGEAFDDIYVQRLRNAHGKIFPVIGLVRATTESEPVRKLAQSTNAFVLTHLTLLESTGLVRYEELPKALPPATGPIAAAGERAALQGGIATPVIWIILATALIAGAVFTTRMIRPQSFGGRHKGSRSEPVNTGPIPVRSGEEFYPRDGLRLTGSPR